MTESQLLKEWEPFLGAKFSRPESDSNRNIECLVAEDDLLNDRELNECLNALRSGKAVGCDNVPGTLSHPTALPRISRVN